MQRTLFGRPLNHYTVRRSTHGQLICQTEAIWWFNVKATR